VREGRDREVKREQERDRDRERQRDRESACAGVTPWCVQREVCAREEQENREERERVKGARKAYDADAVPSGRGMWSIQWDYSEGTNSDTRTDAALVTSSITA
jgi:hypothetical protein